MLVLMNLIWRRLAHTMLIGSQPLPLTKAPPCASCYHTQGTVLAMYAYDARARAWRAL